MAQPKWAIDSGRSVSRDMPQHPLGTHFQFRTFGSEPLASIGVTMPPWPSEGETIKGLRHGGNSEGAYAKLSDAQLRAMSGHRMAAIVTLYAQGDDATTQDRGAKEIGNENEKTRNVGMSR